MSQLGLRRRASERRCPLCREALELEGALQCEGCYTGYHAECLAELGGCATLGCRAPGTAPLTSLEERCAACARSIQLASQRSGCEHCGRAYHLRCAEGRGCVAGCGEESAPLPASLRVGGWLAGLLLLGLLIAFAAGAPGLYLRIVWAAAGTVFFLLGLPLLLDYTLRRADAVQRAEREARRAAEQEVAEREAAEGEASEQEALTQQGAPSELRAPSEQEAPSEDAPA